MKRNETIHRNGHVFRLRHMRYNELDHAEVFDEEVLHAKTPWWFLDIEIDEDFRWSFLGAFRTRREAESEIVQYIKSQKNDALRQQIPQIIPPNCLVVTRGIAALPPEDIFKILKQVREFDYFPPGDDPYGEHDRSL